MFINPLTIDLHFDLHILQMKWIEKEIKIVWLERGGRATLTVLNFLKIKLWVTDHTFWVKCGEGVAKFSQEQVRGSLRTCRKKQDEFLEGVTPFREKWVT